MFYFWLFVAWLWFCPLGSVAAWLVAGDGAHLWPMSNQREEGSCTRATVLGCCVTCRRVPGLLRLGFSWVPCTLTHKSCLMVPRVAMFPERRSDLGHPAVEPPHKEFGL